MRTESQAVFLEPPSGPHAVIVAGEAGSGKTTLGTELARALSLTLLDLDSLTNPLLDALVPSVLDTHWLTGPHAPQIRAGRYGALRAVAHDVIAAGQGVVLVAPFTAELAGGAEWEELADALRPADPRVLYLAGSPDALAIRRAKRGEDRDRFRSEHPSTEVKVPHARIEVLLSPPQQLFRALQALGVRHRIDQDSAVFGETFEAVLFDLDGTLADSTAAVLRSWSELAREFGFAPEDVQGNHGQPAETLLGRLVPTARLDAALKRVEDLEVADLGDVTATPGASIFFGAIPQSRRAVVTSGTRRIATARLRAAGFEIPATLITRDDVLKGKPDPEPFLLAARQLGTDPARCLVVEDASAGIHAAKAAGCAVLAVRGTSPDAELSDADLIVDSLDQVKIELEPAGLGLTTLLPN